MSAGCVDLHTHSNCSDGSMSPSELVIHAAQCGLAAIALTDHDTVSGVAEAVAQGRISGIEVVPGIEFSARSKTLTHILGYYIDINNSGIVSILKEVVEKRKERNVRTAELLRELGFDVTVEEAAKLAVGGIIGRAHYAKLLMDKGYTSSVKESFDKYLASGKPAYFSNQKLEAKRIIEAIHAAGGVAFLAHPHQMKLGDGLEDYVNELVSYGLDGIEGYYSEYDEAMQNEYQALAKRYGLMISGGTDFHCDMKPHISIGTGIDGNVCVPYSVLETIKKSAGVR
ncbi:MAG: PHP domain-containing protein [Clostridia bacterium]|nr:PHP domain-containing protein [Clostridia bacterium]